jgi:hypothetical protein
MNKKLLKPFYLKVQAIKVTKKNFQELKKLDTGEGVLGDEMEDVEGECFVWMDSGYQIFPGHTKLIPVFPR